MSNVQATRFSDQISERLHPQHDTDTVRIFNEITPQDRSAAYGRQEADRLRDASNLNLPRLSIVGDDSNHRAEATRTDGVRTDGVRTDGTVTGRTRDVVNITAMNHTQINLTILDTDNDGSLSRTELQRALRRPTVNRSGGVFVDSQRTAVSLLRHFNEIAGLDHSDSSNPHITRSDISALNRLPANHPLARNMNRELNEVRGLNVGLWDESRGIIPNAVDQGAIGNCTLMSALASLASNPEGQRFIAGMIRQDGNRFRVSFGNGQTITTERPTSAEMGFYARDSRHGIWPNVLERAFGESRPGNDGLRPQTSGSSLWAGQVLDILFGPAGSQGNRWVRTHIDFNRVSDDQLHDQLARTAPSSMLMIASTVDRPNYMAHRTDANGLRIAPAALSERHSYAVDHYDTTNRIVYLRNPWNAAEVVRVPLYNFRRQFQELDAVTRRAPNR